MTRKEAITEMIKFYEQMGRRGNIDDYCEKWYENNDDECPIFEAREVLNQMLKEL